MGYAQEVSTVVSNALPKRSEKFAGVSILGLAGVAAVGVGFAVLLALVRDQWDPLERVDHGVASGLNAWVSGHPLLVDILKIVTAFGGRTVLWCMVALATAILVLRRRSRLALYVLITGVGALILDPTLKLIVGRLRPVVHNSVATAPGNSFPSGHALGSFVWYGALLLVFLPALPQRARKPVIAAVALLVAAIGFSRMALGVHYLSDVVGGWLLGGFWLTTTAFAFEMWRHDIGRRSTAPLEEGLEPEAARDLKLAELPARPVGAFHYGARLAVAWVFVFGLVAGLGFLVTRDEKSNVLGDQTIPRALADHRTAALNGLSGVLSEAGNTEMVLAGSFVFAILTLAVTRRWRQVAFLVAAMFGEVTLFLASVALIARQRPDVPRLDGHLPTSSYPSGHVAATICLYAGIAIVVMTSTRRWWRWLFVALAVVMPLLVTWGRLYRGMHHPTDILGSVVLAGAWLTAAVIVLDLHRARR
jgi:undecaprenyl-diphosphatase